MIINRIEIVTSFELDESIILTCGSSLKHLQTKLGGKVVSINIPGGAPPSLPRVVLTLEDTILNIGLDRFHITTRPPSHIARDFVSAVQFAKQRTGSISKDLFECMPTYKWSGVIIELEFPEDPLTSKSYSEASIPLFNRLIQIDRRDRELSSFQLNYGIKEECYFITYTIKTYEERNITIDPTSQSKIHILDASKFSLSGCGIQVAVDVNNKPEGTNKNALEDIELIFQKHKEVFDKLSDELNLRGILP